MHLTSNCWTLDLVSEATMRFRRICRFEMEWNNGVPVCVWLRRNRRPSPTGILSSTSSTMGDSVDGERVHAASNALLAKQHYFHILPENHKLLNCPHCAAWICLEQCVCVRMPSHAIQCMVTPLASMGDSPISTRMFCRKYTEKRTMGRTNNEQPFNVWQKFYFAK